MKGRYEMSLPDSESKPKSNQSFTSIKLTWMVAFMSIKTRYTPFDKCVAFVIMNAINEKTRDWKLSDETIAALAGKPGSIRSVIRSRMKLRAGGWIGWKRTADANVYFLCHENVMAALDEIMQGRIARRERRKNKPTRDTRVTPQSDTRVIQTYSRDIHEKKKKKGLPIAVHESQQHETRENSNGKHEAYDTGRGEGRVSTAVGDAPSQQEATAGGVRSVLGRGSTAAITQLQAGAAGDPRRAAVNDADAWLSLPPDERRRILRERALRG